jgi:hypothetical protein
MKMYIDDVIELLENCRGDSIAETVDEEDLRGIIAICERRYERVNTP